MFSIWEEDMVIGIAFKNVFDALTCMQKHNIKGKVKDETGRTIVSLSKNGIDWMKGYSPLSNLTTKTAAYLLGLSQIRISQFCLEGRLGHKFGKSWAITLNELEKFAAQERLSGVGFNQKSKKKVNTMTLDDLLIKLDLMGYKPRKSDLIKEEMKRLPFTILTMDALNGIRISSRDNKMFLVNGYENNDELQELKREYNNKI